MPPGEKHTGEKQSKEESPDVEQIGKAPTRQIGKVPYEAKRGTSRAAAVSSAVRESGPVVRESGPVVRESDPVVLEWVLWSSRMGTVVLENGYGPTFLERTVVLPPEGRKARASHDAARVIGGPLSAKRGGRASRWGGDWLDAHRGRQGDVQLAARDGRALRGCRADDTYAGSEVNEDGDFAWEDNDSWEAIAKVREDRVRTSNGRTVTANPGH
ncbi:hypothetical protein EV714DRAFT_236196 [Schizophyllum commune]